MDTLYQVQILRALCLAGRRGLLPSLGQQDAGSVDELTVTSPSPPSMCFEVFTIGKTAKSGSNWMAKTLRIPHPLTA